MVLEKGYKGGRSRGISTKTSDPPPPPHPKQYRKLSKMPLKTNPLWVQHCQEDGRMTQFKPNDKLSLRAEYIPRNMDASVFLQCSIFFEPYTTNCVLVR